MSSVSYHFAHLKIPLEAIKLATNNFSDDNQIGGGGFGKVYKGELVHSGRRVMVAVKRSHPIYGQGLREFWKEIMMLSRCKHENLVSLLGFNDDGGEYILVYNYLPNQSLDMHISTDTLSWIQRLIICLGAARGLEYLHNPGSTKERVLHLDIKSSNILLDQNWNAKISDFGLSKFGPANQEITFLISNIGVGTKWYMDPLVQEEGIFTKESDIYSFGVVLFEVLSGRFCFRDYYDGHPHLPKWARDCYEKNEISAIIHDCLREQISPKCLDNFSSIAYQCLQRERDDRPPISEIVKQLELALEYQVKYNFEKERKLKSHDEIEQDMEPLPLSIHRGDTSMTEEQLRAYDGRDPDKPLLIAIEGEIYDVSRNRRLYKPDGPYAKFAGKEISRALEKKSFEKDLDKDVNDPSPFELEILIDWQERFTSKYAKVGFIETPILQRKRWINKLKNQIS